LANSFDEALSGAIKLARYVCNLQNRSPRGLVIDAEGRLGYFASMSFRSGSEIAFLPELVIAGPKGQNVRPALQSGDRFGLVVLLVSDRLLSSDGDQELQALVREQSPLLITCVDRAALTILRQHPPGG
jgi:hypothetical protein